MDWHRMNTVWLEFVRMKILFICIHVPFTVIDVLNFGWSWDEIESHRSFYRPRFACFGSRCDLDENQGSFETLKRPAFCVPMVRCPVEDVSYLLVKKIEGRACLCGIFATLMAPTDPKWRFFCDCVCVCDFHLQQYLESIWQSMVLF